MAPFCFGSKAETTEIDFPGYMPGQLYRLMSKLWRPLSVGAPFALSVPSVALSVPSAMQTYYVCLGPARQRGRLASGSGEGRSEG